MNTYLEFCSTGRLVSIPPLIYLFSHLFPQVQTRGYLFSTLPHDLIVCVIYFTHFIFTVGRPWIGRWGLICGSGAPTGTRITRYRHGLGSLVWAGLCEGHDQREAKRTEAVSFVAKPLP